MAELAIGSVSFFFQAFAGCIQGYELIADACRLQKDCQGLLVRFKIEEHRLLDWAKLVRLDYHDDQLVLNHLSKGLIINIMEQQQKLLFSFGRLNKKYEKLSEPLLEEMAEQFVLQNFDRLLENGESNGETSADGSSKSVRFPPPEELVEMSLKFMSKFKDVPKRLKWATFDHAKMEALIVKLEGFNNKMEEALNKAQMDRLVDMHTRTNDQIVLLNRTMSQMVQIYRSEQLPSWRQYAITDLEDSEYDLLSGGAGQLTENAARQPLAASAQQHFIQLAIEGPDPRVESHSHQIGLPDLARDIDVQALNFADFQPTHGETFPEETEEGDRTEALYNGTPVWIEWRTPDSTALAQEEGVVDSKIHARVRKLVACLSKNNRTVRFRAPFCRGYFIDEDIGRFGLVFEKPASVPAETVPTSLHALMLDPAVDMPPLDDRITLMKLLAETVERLHAVDWLHKGLRSSNVLFFASSPQAIKYADPYISGFDYSRPAASDDLTERPHDNPSADIYRHPSVQHRGNRDDPAPDGSHGGRSSYKKSFDLYALGIVLLEIAYWKPIDAVLDIDLLKAKPKHTWAVRQRLLDEEPKVLRYVKAHLGTTVEGVIRACLVGPEAFGLDAECDERREVVAAGLQRGFGEKVVGRLGEMRGLGS
ncbi:hypothetical protein IQ07DRAFT_605680 [Pyrenochaeta sp. DS3sAY3a]|nr:hypothetical protein IQ07DRAFT_605680 [Pyrenochaeta sp. DS3sAY3a]